MIKRKLFVVFAVFLILCVQQIAKAQNQSNVAIRFNEYSASNVGTPVDNYGQQSDWVEIYNGFTSPVSLSGYYLSNDRNNLFKWKIPPGFIMGVSTYSVIWLSGRDELKDGNYHANFTLDQCKNQWLILVTPQGARRDSVFIQKTKAGHSWARVNDFNSNSSDWKLYAAHSFGYLNPLVNNYKGYVPTPRMITTPVANPNPATSTLVNSGGFYPDGATIMYFKFDGSPIAYDTKTSCFDIWYTVNGDYPVVGGSTSTQYMDSLTTPIPIAVTMMIRAIAVVKAPSPLPPDPTAPPSATANCVQEFLPSFCETNTYFVDAEHLLFDARFGVVSIALDQADQPFFDSNGNPPNTPVHIEYYENKKQVTEGYGTITRPPNEEWLTVQKGFNMGIDDRDGFGCNFEGNIFNVEGLGTSSRTVFPTLQMYGGDYESASPPAFSALTNTAYGTGIRDVFYQSLAIKYNINVNPLHMKPVVAFMNGKYWGVFTLKEVYDKYYESYYHKQPQGTLDLAFYQNTDGYVSYRDGSISKYLPFSNFKTSVYDVVTTRAMTGPFYKSVITQLDKSSFMDYMIMNSYAMNSSLWSYNVAYARGGLAASPTVSGDKWHYYLWNTPAIFNFTAIATSTVLYNNPYYPTCTTYTNNYGVSPQQAGNGHGIIMQKLMTSITGSEIFKQEYKTRYQDLLNTALQCDNILKHFDYVQDLYKKEMLYMEDPVNLSPFKTTPSVWDTNMIILRRVIEKRCYFVEKGLGNGCFSMTGPYPLTVDVEPIGAGSVKLNSITLDHYQWSGYYYQGAMSFKAIPTNTTYAFHHWEFKNHVTLNAAPLSLDSVAITLARGDEVVAVFTDKSAEIQSGVNVPTGFTPNGDGNNDVFKPLGSALYMSEYEMTVWNRWGQEVFRSLSAADGWDGNYKGQEAITGVYAFIIKYKNIYGESKLLKGNVTLTR